MPPMDEAKAMNPSAVLRLFLNQWAMTLITGPNITPHEIYQRPPLAICPKVKIRSTDANAKALTE